MTFRRTLLFPLTSVAVVVLFYLLVSYFSVNIPQQDDFDSILYYLVNSQGASLNHLFDIHVSHRPVLTRLLAKLSVLTTGSLNLKFIVVVSSLSLLGVLALFHRSVRDSNHKPAVMLMLALSLFSLFPWSDMAWATAAAQNYPALLVATWCFYLFGKKTRGTAAAALGLALIAPYISSNGLLLLPILLVWSFLNPVESHSRLSVRAMLFVATATSFLLFYAVFPQQAGSDPRLVPSLPGISDIWRLLIAYLVASAGYLHFQPLALLAGLVVNGYFLVLIALGYYRSNGLVFFIYLYLLLSLALVALFRYELGTGQVTASRYQIFTLLLNALIVISAFDLGLHRQLKIRNVSTLLTVAFGLLYLSSFYYLTNLSGEREKIRTGLNDWLATNGPSLYHPVPERAASLLRQAMAAEIYAPPDQQVAGKR